ncbi:MAG: hypothetical protein Q4G60_09580 [bacterium]|nr:hypothetical protein [bacterium]
MTEKMKRELEEKVESIGQAKALTPEELATIVGGEGEPKEKDQEQEFCYVSHKA